MIRYDFDEENIISSINALDSRWMAKAAKRTRQIESASCYNESSSIWSTVKPIYMHLQNDKCIYCEQRLEGGVYGPVEWDLEHFRPKSSVASWPDPIRHPDLSYENLGEASGSGYYWLSYDLRNYAASCKVCNTIFKLDWFPVNAQRASAQSRDLRLEQAILCYPLGDEDPEELISFVLTTAVPKYLDGERNVRASIIIDFFGLNKRDKLHRDRAQMIGVVGSLLTQRDNGQATPEILSAIDKLSNSFIPHAACVRSFIKFWEDENEKAIRGYQACLNFGFDPSSAPPNI